MRIVITPAWRIRILRKSVSETAGDPQEREKFPPQCGADIVGGMEKV
jgi:hypothetical protein